MGALRTAGSAVLIAGIVVFVVSFVFGVALVTVPGSLDNLLRGNLTVDVANLMVSGLLWGPLLIVLGLGLRYAPTQRIRKAGSSS